MNSRSKEVESMTEVEMSKWVREMIDRAKRHFTDADSPTTNFHACEIATQLSGVARLELECREAKDALWTSIAEAATAGRFDAALVEEKLREYHAVEDESELQNPNGNT